MKTKIIWITSTIILFVMAILFWGVVDRVGDAVGEIVSDVVGNEEESSFFIPFEGSVFVSNNIINSSDN
jgi:hypothetical protein